MKKKFLEIQSKTLKDLGATTYKELWESVKEEYDGIRVGVLTDFDAKKADDGRTRYAVTLSTDSEDRHGDIVKQSWVLKNFKKNPVVVDSHKYDSIFHILGSMPKIGVREGALKGEIEFNTVSFEGFMAEKMVEKGFVNAGSVGFIPLEFDEKGNISKSELLEFSLVSVPANPEALFEKVVKEFKAENDPVTPENTESDQEPTSQPETPQEQPQEPAVPDNGVVMAPKSKREALRRWAKQKEQRRKQLLRESLAVIRRLDEKEHNASTRRRMVNRAVAQLLKVKD